MKFKIAYHYMEIKEGAEVKMPNDAIKAAGDDIKDELQECLLVLGLNVKNKICYKDLVAKGSINHLQAVPADIIRPLLMSNCQSAILMHNHPSGSASPSEEDILFTRKVDKAFKIMGMSLLDHIIVSHDEDFSFKREALL